MINTMVMMSLTDFWYFIYDRRSPGDVADQFPKDTLIKDTLGKNHYLIFMAACVYQNWKMQS